MLVPFTDMPCHVLQIVAGWNGMAISALAMASRVLPGEDPPVESCFPVDGVSPDVYLEAAQQVVAFIMNSPCYGRLCRFISTSWASHMHAFDRTWPCLLLTKGECFDFIEKSFLGVTCWCIPGVEGLVYFC